MIKLIYILLIFSSSLLSYNITSGGVYLVCETSKIGADWSNKKNLVTYKYMLDIEYQLKVRIEREFPEMIYTGVWKQDTKNGNMILETNRRTGIKPTSIKVLVPYPYFKINKNLANESIARMYGYDLISTIDRKTLEITTSHTRGLLSKRIIKKLGRCQSLDKDSFFNSIQQDKENIKINLESTMKGNII